MIINHNLGAMNANRMMGVNASKAGKSMEKLSSGLRINKAGDDAAGLAISEKMRGQIRGLDQASSNAQDGISMVQTAEGALSETHSILQRMRELAVQGSNDTNVAVDRNEIQKEMDELAKEVTRIANNTEFNTQKLINGGIKDEGVKSAKFHVGANANQDITLSINAMDAKSLGVSRDATKTTGTGTGDVATATFESTVGSKVVDKAAITFAYSTEAIDKVATKGVDTTGGAIAVDKATADAKTITTGGDLSLKIDGKAVNVTITALDTVGDTVTAINTAANTALGTTGETYASIDATGKLNIESLTTGATSGTEVVGVSAGTALTELKIAAAAGVKGTDAVTAGDKVTISNTAGDKQVIDITDKTAKTLKVNSGDYKGMTINMAEGKTLAELDATNDKVTVASTTTNAAAAKFGSNEKTADAVTEAGIDVSTQDKASTAITTIQNAIETVSAERSKLGAYTNRLEHTINNLGTSSENLTSAESRIRDVDMAKEMSTFSKNNILNQAAQAMLAQANQQPQQVLQLLR